MNENGANARKSMFVQDYPDGPQSAVNYTKYAGPVYNQYNNLTGFPSHQGHRRVVSGPSFGHASAHFVAANPSGDYYENELQPAPYASADPNDQLLLVPAAAAAAPATFDPGAGQHPSGRAQFNVGADFQSAQQPSQPVSYYNQPAAYPDQSVDVCPADTFQQPIGAPNPAYYQYSVGPDYKPSYYVPQPQHYRAVPQVCAAAQANAAPAEPASLYEEQANHYSKPETAFSQAPVVNCARAAPVAAANMPPTLRPSNGGLFVAAPPPPPVGPSLLSTELRAPNFRHIPDKGASRPNQSSQQQARYQKQQHYDKAELEREPYFGCCGASDMAPANDPFRRSAAERTLADFGAIKTGAPKPKEPPATRMKPHKLSHGAVKKITKDGIVIARRKNATREITAILKCWLELNLGNPYPNKSEKGVLSSASGMTGTQVSTWFANARRRMKKEEKFYECINCKPPEKLHRGPKASEVRLASAIASRALQKLSETINSSATSDPATATANASLLSRLRKFVDQLSRLADEKRKEEQVGSSTAISSSSSSRPPNPPASSPTLSSTSSPTSASSSTSESSSESSSESRTASTVSPQLSPSTPKIRQFDKFPAHNQPKQQPSSTTNLSGRLDLGPFQ